MSQTVPLAASEGILCIYIQYPYSKKKEKKKKKKSPDRWSFTLHPSIVGTLCFVCVNDNSLGAFWFVLRR